jgi:hypothetical protein
VISCESSTHAVRHRPRRQGRDERPLLLPCHARRHPPHARRRQRLGNRDAHVPRLDRPRPTLRWPRPASVLDHHPYLSGSVGRWFVGRVATLASHSAVTGVNDACGETPAVADCRVTSACWIATMALPDPSARPTACGRRARPCPVAESRPNRLGPSRLSTRPACASTRDRSSRLGANCDDAGRALTNMGGKKRVSPLQDLVAQELDQRRPEDSDYLNQPAGLAAMAALVPSRSPHSSAAVQAAE